MNTRTVKCQVNDEYVIGAGVVLGAEGSHDDVILELTFSKLWLGLTKSITWWDALGEHPVRTILTIDTIDRDDPNVYRVPVPAEAKAMAGEMELTIKGAEIEGDLETRATMSVTTKFRILPGKWAADAGEVQDVTPSQAEQIQASIDAVRDGIVSAVEASAAAAVSEANAAASAAAARVSETNAAASEANAAASAAAGRSSETNAAASETNARTSEVNAKASETAAKTSETNAKASETAAKTSETNAKASEEAAKSAAEQAAEEAAKSAAEQAAEEAAQKTDALLADKVAAARKAEANAKASENAAKTSETNAKASETAAKTSEANAKASETAAKAAEKAAKTSESSAASSASSAASSKAAAETAKTKAEAAQAAAEKARNEAEGIVGGDYISRPEAKALVDQGVRSANDYTNRAIAAIPAPDVSGQIQAHDANHTAHGDIRQALAAHEINRENPHGVTAEQAGAAPAAHVNDAVKHITAEERTAWNGKANEADLSIHTGNKNNPHNVTAEQVGAIAAGAVGNLHVWKKENRSYTITLSSGVTGQISINGMNKTIQYSYQIYMVGMKVALKNPVTLTYPDEALNGIGSAVKGNYLCVPGGKVYFAEYYEDRGDYLTIGCKDVTLSYDAKTIDYLTYKTASVYPYDDEVDGHHYTYLGQLGAQPSAEEIGAATTQDFTVPVTDAWDAVPDRGYSQRVSVSGIESSDNPIIDVVLGSDIAANALYLEAYALVTRVSTSNGAVTLWCDNDTPTVAFTIKMKVVR